AKPGTLVNPERPYPVSGGNVETTQRIADLTLHALSQCVDGIPSASSGTMFNVMMGGRGSNGKYWSYYETIGGGNGAGPHRNGVSGVHSNMTNTLNTPVEVVEREYPIFFTSYTLRRNSGGKGNYKGGEGVIRSFRVTRKSYLSIIADRFNIRPYALSGGSEGKPGSAYIKHGKKKMKMSSKFTRVIDQGDEVILETPGGSGYGKGDA
ncbi:MAG: hydantoinase B/oxoprolinase family protein, partial [Candidatus Thermoplasmatota archaeon]|nr:hydantoinase B/oxoprolinase family protein [Candidatus Thermoplasmatota archaeon]